MIGQRRAGVADASARTRLARLVAALGLAVLAGLARAAAPPVDAVAFAPAPHASVPLEARFVDEHGRAVRLGDYLREHPVLLVPAYYGCSNLCGVVLAALASGLASAGLHAGRALEVVVFSIAPLDTPEDALARKRATLGAASGGERAGWHFLTGGEAAIAQLASALGYRYAYVPGERQYAHASGVAVVARNGSIVRVLYGAAFSRPDLDDALAAATAKPDAAPSVEPSPASWLLCFHYDPHTGRYTFAAMAAVRAAALLTLAALAAYVAREAWRARRRSRGTRAPR